MTDAYTDNRNTLRVFYAPKERTPRQRYEDALAARVEHLEALTADLTEQLSERTQELLYALDELERRGRL